MAPQYGPTPRPDAFSWHAPYRILVPPRRGNRNGLERARTQSPTSDEPEPNPQPLPPADTPVAEAPPALGIGASIDELARLLQDVSDAAGALLRLALAETALSATALRRLFVLRIAVIVLFTVAATALTVAAIIALSNWLGSTALAFAIIGFLFAALGLIAGRRAELWRGRIGYAETRAALREGLQRGPTDGA
jgi:hypothetical protein